MARRLVKRLVGAQAHSAEALGGEGSGHREAEVGKKTSEESHPPAWPPLSAENANTGPPPPRV